MQDGLWCVCVYNISTLDLRVSKRHQQSAQTTDQKRLPDSQVGEPLLGVYFNGAMTHGLSRSNSSGLTSEEMRR